MNKQQVKSPQGGYSYSYSDETIKEYMALFNKAKLEWLEQVNSFLYKFTPPENRKIWEKFRKGERLVLM